MFSCVAGSPWKHPHVRGEDIGPVVERLQKEETPPRAWGRQTEAKGILLEVRNTPTCVGKTFCGISKAFGSGKHPHVRGEDAGTEPDRGRKEETPPRAWGRLERADGLAGLKGNTPTCVGKTLQDPHFLPLHQKHPHVRGEDVFQQQDTVTKAETPPRAWGRLRVISQYLAIDRNTPTCVGKTLQLLHNRNLMQKHPHVRGEDAAPEAALLVKPETPPRAWGRPHDQSSLWDGNGNTPTCVGKTPIRKRCVRNDGKHPHVRGEDSKEERDQWRERETPPRAWGRPAYEIQHGADGRNTPTCVGKTTVLDQKGR